MMPFQEKPGEEPYIPKYQKVYASDAWRAIMPGDDRACLVLIAEGEKPGAFLCADQKVIPDAMLSALGLHWRTLPQLGRIVGDEARIQMLAAGVGETRPEDFTPEQHKLLGEFLGFPECCREAHAKRTPKDTELYWQEMRAAYREEKYPPEFAISPFMPCSIDCTPARTLLTGWERVLTASDPANTQCQKEMNTLLLSHTTSWRDWLQQTHHNLRSHVRRFLKERY